MTITFNGYRRSDGTVGVRNHLAIIPSVFCANRTVERIAAQLPGSVPIRHAVGCSQVGLDLELTARTLKALGTHPNVGAVLVIGLGCERFPPRELEEAAGAPSPASSSRKRAAQPTRSNTPLKPAEKCSPVWPNSGACLAR